MTGRPPCGTARAYTPSCRGRFGGCSTPRVRGLLALASLLGEQRQRLALGSGRVQVPRWREQMGWDIPALAVVGNHGDGLAIVFDHRTQQASALMGKADALTRNKAHHLQVRLHRFEHFQTRHHALVELQHFLEAQAVNVYEHGRDPSALEGVPIRLR